MKAILLSFVLCTVLAACGEKPAATTATPTGGSPAKATPPAPTQVQESAASGATQTTEEKKK